MHAQHALKRRHVLLHRGAGLVADAGVVDQRTNARALLRRLCRHLLHRPRDVGFGGHVTGQSKMLRAEFSRAFARRVASEVEQGHAPAIRRQPAGGGPADAVGSAGHDGGCLGCYWHGVKPSKAR